ncbi:hypothetical protein LAZ40_09955 [Cereibacter sphaeroides]|uniref:hypothetical protein n=1 Tax=Cereibacter sphaeroides TaxID=1063 RepID=UPI001F2D4764|nr:hypothetical protein [Cereibacter sphaeroides]MCE6959375.1 hypothetical protein [Cereibacter sphaeroides]MCE6972967.1 hypothetical protein [Cereibacter sphaeroides]
MKIPTPTTTLLARLHRETAALCPRGVSREAAAEAARHRKARNQASRETVTAIEALVARLPKDVTSDERRTLRLGLERLVTETLVTPLPPGPSVEAAGRLLATAGDLETHVAALLPPRNLLQPEVLATYAQRGSDEPSESPDTSFELEMEVDRFFIHDLGIRNLDAARAHALEVKALINGLAEVLRTLKKARNRTDGTCPAFRPLDHAIRMLQACSTDLVALRRLGKARAARNSAEDVAELKARYLRRRAELKNRLRALATAIRALKDSRSAVGSSPEACRATDTAIRALGAEFREVLKLRNRGKIWAAAVARHEPLAQAA